MLDIHYLFTYSSTCAALACQHYNVPYTLRTIGQLTPWAISQSKIRKKLYTALVERRNLNRAGVIHCTSLGELEDVTRFGVTAPKVVIPLGVSKTTIDSESRTKLRTHLGIRPDVPLILFLSRLHPKKRPELLFAVIRAMRDAGSTAELVFAGNGTVEYESSLKKLAVALGVSKQIHFVGFVQDAEKALVLGGCDVFALPSYSENFGIAVAEAMAAGLPVVITPDVQIAPEVTASRAGLVVEGSVSAFTEALLQIVNSPSLRDEYGENGRMFAAKHYCWEAIAKRCMVAYQRVIKGLDPCVDGD